MENQRKTFVFNTAWYTIIRNCSMEVKGEVFSAVMEYFESGKIIDMGNEAYVIFQFIKREIDRRETRRRKSITSTAEKTANEIIDNQPETSPVSETQITSEAANPQIDREVLPPTPPYRMTRQMRRKLQRQGLLKAS